MEVIITEKRLTKVLYNYLNKNIKGFDRCEYNWAEFYCGMGVCCDPYAVEFSLPDSIYGEHLFKLVNDKYYKDDGDYPEELKGDLPEPCYNNPDINDGEFNTIIIYEDMYETIRKIFGNINIWRDSLLSILNNTYGLNAKTLLYMYS